MGQKIRKFAHLTYLTTTNDLRKTLAKENFIDTLVDANMSLTTKQARIQIESIQELEAFIKSEFRSKKQMSMRAVSGDLPRNNDSDTNDELT